MLLLLYKKDLNPIRLPILLAMSVYVFTSHSLLWYLSICSRKSFWARLGHSVSIQSIILGVVRDFHFCKSSFLATNRALRRHPSWLEHRSLLWHPWTFYGSLEVLQTQKRENSNLYALTNEHLAAAATLLLSWTQKMYWSMRPFVPLPHLEWKHLCKKYKIAASTSHPLCPSMSDLYKHGVNRPLSAL